MWRGLRAGWCWHGCLVACADHPLVAAAFLGGSDAAGWTFGIDPTRLALEDTESLLPALADQERYRET